MKRTLAIVLTLLMLVSVMPLSTLAADVQPLASSEYGAGLTVVTDSESNLAPGVTLNEVVALDSNNDRVEMYVTTVDTTVDTVKVYANYKDNQNSEYGLQTLSEQVAAMEANYEEPFKVVAGINASYYNTATGKPTGAFVMEGIDVTTVSEGNNYAFFAVLKDGTYMIGNKGEYSSYIGQIKEAIGGYVHIVKDGQVASGLDKTTKYPRQTLGLTADGKLILMTADGSQVPKTIGLTYQEQAEVMLSLGCVDAIHLDGGNSATFGGVREGESEFTLINTPSGNVERAVSNTLCIVTTAVADGTFDHAVIEGDHEYMAPNSTYTFTAKGIDASGGPADEIPADVTWALSDSSFGTIKDGKFVSNGTLGNVDIQMVLDGKVVGSKTISVVNPTSIAFDAETKTLPYGKSTDLTVVAMYGNNEIYVSAEAFDFTIADPTAGSMSGFSFTATTTETCKGTSVTAEYKYAEMDAITVTINYGKGSEVIYDFEQDNVDEWIGVDKFGEWADNKNAEIAEQYPDAKYDIVKLSENSNGVGFKSSSTFLATEENGGQVKNGNSSLGLTFDRLYDQDTGSWSYNYVYYTGDTQVWRDVENGKNATKIGMWIYLPDSASGLYARICRTFTKDSSGKLYTNYDYMTVNGTKFSQFTNIPESGWVYAEFDLTAYDYQSSLQFNPYEDYAINNGKGANTNNYPAFIQFFVNTYDMDAEKVTIYIDDITLDYSDVTEDRDAPVISDAKISQNIDNFVALNGQTVSNNQVSFEATIADSTKKDNYTGLDYSTAKIYIDGIDMSKATSFKAAGTTMALSDVYLTNGTHEIVFEVADKQGNYTKLTKTLTVAATATNPIVTISGHNNGNETPKAGSVYYVDVVASDASKIDSITTTLKMQTANTFEPEYIVTADGVTVDYTLDELNNELTLTITNNGDATGETILASVPVRVWAWSEEITGLAPSKQQATTNSPIVNIIVDTVYGEVDYADGVVDNNYVCGFYSAINVKTEVQDINLTSGGVAWHEHNATALEDKAATCTECGYTGRTYCEGCSSVVDWGTTVDATGHNYVVSDGKLVCESCSTEKTQTGLYTDETGTYYFINGVAQKGWQTVDGAWYYFTDSGVGYDGEMEFIPGVTYSLTDGKLDSGVWAKTLYGNKYYYGPTYHAKGWVNIDGEDYFFENGIALASGWELLFESQAYRNWYYFNEDGTCDKTMKPEDGFIEFRNGLGYAKDGEGLAGLCNIDGDWYYFHHTGYAQKNGTYGGRIFKDDYAAYTGLLTVNNVLYVYEDGVTGNCGLYEFDGEYYYSYWGGVVKTNGKYYIDNSFCDLPAGEYTFGEDGKMVRGLIETEDGLCYYLNGKPAAAGLYNIDGDYYFVKANGICSVNEKRYAWATNCDLPVGEYTFGEDGKMLNGVVEIDGTKYLYVNGRTATKGLFEIDGDYYYSYWGGVLRTDGKYWVDTTYCDLPANANYTFGPDGKMYNGVVDIDGTLYLYINGLTSRCGLFEIDGDYYYAYWGGVIKTDGKYWVDTTYCDLPANANYTFGPDGKMYNGVVDIDGTKYLYINGLTSRCGLFEVDGDYYYAYWGGVIKTDGKYWVDTTYCDLPIGEYTFGEDGKMLNGVAEVDGTKYLYFDGKTSTKGLFEIDGEYYYASWGGVLQTGGKYWVDTTYCDLPANKNYEFDADGKMLDGFVTKDDGIYYYVDGTTPAPGLIEVDGYYYFVNWGGKLVTNQTFYVWETNGYTIPMNYKFDDLGRVCR